MTRDPNARRPPGSIVAEVRATLRALGVRRGARLWGLGERQALELAAGLRVRAATVVTAIRHHLARLEAGDV